MTTVKSIYQSAVSGQVEISIDISKAESEQLRQALAVIDKYKKIAYSEIRKKIGDICKSDWTEIEYAVKNDKVIIQITDGSCG